MKATLKKTLSLLLVIVMVTALLPVSAIAAREELSGTVVNPLYADVITESYIESFLSSISYNSTRVKDVPEVYGTFAEAGEELRNRMVDRQVPITVAVDQTAEDFAGMSFEEIANAIMSEALCETENGNTGDYLRYQFGAYQIVGAITGNTMSITYTIDFYTNSQQEEAVSDKVVSVLQELDIENLDEVDKIAAIFRYITANVVYDYGDDSSYMLKYTAYAALIQGLSVCQGYANLFYRMCKEAGISTRIISGIGNGDSHAWNIVRVGDLYYNVDCTWDAGAFRQYSYFLKCDANFENHVRQSFSGIDYTGAEFYAEYPMSLTDYSYEFPYVPVTGIVLDNYVVTIDALQNAVINCIVLPVNATNKDVDIQIVEYTMRHAYSWYRNSGRLIVSPQDLSGTIRFRFTTVDGGYSAECLINVVEELPEPVSSWEELRQALTQGGAITLGEDVTASEDDESLYVPEGITAALDLNGHTISETITEYREVAAILVDGNLTLNDSVGGGRITGGNGGVYVSGTGSFIMNGGEIAYNTGYFGGGVWNNGTFDLMGGSINGNSAAGNGAGVYNSDMGTFTMTGGSIEGNDTAGEDGVCSAGGVYNEGTFTLSGGEIIGNFNSGEAGAGGILNNGTFNISGDVSIFGNSARIELDPETGAEFGESNVRLAAGKVITVVGELGENTVIGVSMDQPGVFTDGLSGNGTAANFVSDNSDYIVALNDMGEAKLTDTSITIVTQPEPVSAYVGDNIFFYVTAEGPELSYQWQMLTDNTWNEIPGGNSSIVELDVSGYDDGKLVRCVVSNPYTEPVYSDEVLLSVDTSITITSHPEPVSARVGDMVSFYVTAEGPELSYTWQMFIDNEWCEITSGNSSAFYFDVSRDDDGNLVRCVVSNPYTDPVYSDEALLTVEAPPYITSQPESVQAELGETVTFSVVAEGEGLTYRWQLSKDGGNTFAYCTKKVVGSSTDTITIDADMTRDGFVYRCEVTDGEDNVNYSEPAQLAVIQILEINSQPENAEAVFGDSAQFTVGVTGYGLKYRWQLSKDGGQTFASCTSKVPGYNTDTITVPADKTHDGYVYRCMVTDSRGETVYSEAASMSVRYEITVIAQPESRNYSQGDTASFAVTAVGDGLKYHWQLSKDGGNTYAPCTSKVSGYKTSSITVDADKSRNGWMYRCEITDGHGNTVYSDGALLTVVQGIKVTAQPQSVTAELGDTVTFSVTAEGTGLKYHWYLSKDGGETFAPCTSRVTGYNTDTITVQAEMTRAGYVYRCVITDKSGETFTTDPAELIIQ